MSKITQLADAFMRWWEGEGHDASFTRRATAEAAFTEGYALRANEDANELAVIKKLALSLEVLP